MSQMVLYKLSISGQSCLKFSDEISNTLVLQKNCDGHAITSLNIIQDVHHTVQHIQEEVNQLKSSHSDILNRLSKFEKSDVSQQRQVQ